MSENLSRSYMRFFSFCWCLFTSWWTNKLNYRKRI